ncbi:MAG: SPASM domain-containing protein [Deltaproteobacteria bacterium]|nr:SPASM domain-containing protein [Deltaproteobacteria bacterium]
MCGHATENYGFMTKDIFQKIINECKRCEIHALIFGGAWGEPTLHPDWQRMIKVSVSHGFTTLISTNGSRLDTGAIGFLASSGIKQLQISFSGFDKESYESIYINGKFSKINEVLLNIKKIFLRHPSPPEILIHGVVEHSRPQKYVDRIYRYLYSCGYSDSEINMVRPTNFGGKKMNMEDNKVGLKSKTILKSLLQLCTVLTDGVGIYWNGKVTACPCADNDGKMIIGNILEESISDMRKSSYFNNIVRCFEDNNLSSLEMCSKCDIPYTRERNIAAILPSWLGTTGISIIEATYGLNCRGEKGVKIMLGNVTGLLQKKCNWKRKIEFVVDVNELGDRAPGMEKDLVITWCYAEDPMMTPYHLYIPAEAHGKVVAIPMINPAGKTLKSEHE